MVKMNLTVLSESHAATTDELRRRAQHALEIYDCALGERLMLDYGVAIVSQDLAAVPVANQIQSASLAENADPAAMLAEAEAEFASRHALLRRLTLAQPNEALADLLQKRGWLRQSQTIWLLTEPQKVSRREDLHIVPGRSSYAGLRHLADAVLTAEKQEAEITPAVRDQYLLAAERHLDDSRVDSLLVMDESMTPLGVSNMVNAGETGVITSFVVHPNQRGKGVGASLMAATLELAARSRYRHVAIVCGRDEPDVERFYGKCGFTRIGVIESWTRMG